MIKSITRITNLAKVLTYKDQTPSRKNSQLKKIICETLALIANIARIRDLTNFYTCKGKKAKKGHEKVPNFAKIAKVTINILVI